MTMTLSLLAGLIALMFVTTALSSIVNSIRETEGMKQASAKRMSF